MKYKCETEGCKRHIQGIRKYRDKKLICYLCSQKGKTMIPLGRPAKTLKQALEQVYAVKTYTQGQTREINQIHVPSILEGRKVKLVLVDEEGNEINLKGDNMEEGRQTTLDEFT